MIPSFIRNHFLFSTGRQLTFRQKPFCATEIRLVVWWGPLPWAGLLERGNCEGVAIRANDKLNSLKIRPVVCNETSSVATRGRKSTTQTSRQWATAMMALWKHLRETHKQNKCEEQKNFRRRLWGVRQQQTEDRGERCSEGSWRAPVISQLITSGWWSARGGWMLFELSVWVTVCECVSILDSCVHSRKRLLKWELILAVWGHYGINLIWVSCR